MVDTVECGCISGYELYRPCSIYSSAWISYEDPTTAQKLADDLPQFPLGVKPDGSKLIYLSDNKIIELDKSLKTINSTSFDPAQWDYAKSRRNSNPVSFGTAWQPDTSLIFFYSAGACVAAVTPLF